MSLHLYGQMWFSVLHLYGQVLSHVITSVWADVVFWSLTCMGK